MFETTIAALIVAQNAALIDHSETPTPDHQAEKQRA